MHAFIMKSPLLTIRAWRNAPKLDAQLAAGTDPTDTPLLSHRARQLLHWSHRSRLAERLADAARHEPDEEAARSLHSLAVTVSRVEDRDVKTLAAAALVDRNRNATHRVERDHRVDEAELLLRGAAL